MSKEALLQIKRFMYNQERQRLIRVMPSWEQSFCDFSTNDYLALSHNEAVIEAGCRAARLYGAGSTGSRLISGNVPIFAELEARIAQGKKAQAALYFSSGFQANASLIKALVDRDSVLLLDKLNHASMYYGAFASRAKLLRFEHLDYSCLEEQLKENSGRKMLIASETVFGMDGDIADICVLSSLSEKYGALLYLDEAHATGLYGSNGYGLSTTCALNPDTTIIMGTFSKALGGSGAYVACSQLLKDYFIQTCGGFVYSTAPSPFCAGAAICSWDLVHNMGSVRAGIFNLTSVLRQRTTNAGYDVLGADTNIVPIVFPSVEDMFHAKERLRRNGLIVSGIRPPTSPSPRIRIAVNAMHEQDDIETLLNVFTSEPM
ncbi:MAG: 8-amino-7-oxononanoate synthase, partial [Holosporales bacterium]|nr:8-amino-7-oxononanoate synthase [Holosporales bacterium]